MDTGRGQRHLGHRDPERSQSIGHGIGDRSQAAEVYSNHTLTPETETTTHYFWHHARNFRLDDEAFTAALRAMFSSALQEDVVAIQAQQTSLAGMGDTDLIDINVDNASLQGRRLLDECLAADQA